MANKAPLTSAYLEGKPCPSCGYSRSRVDTNPDWQCPRCQVAYVKFDPPPAAPRPARLFPDGRELAIAALNDRSTYALVAANIVAAASRLPAFSFIISFATSGFQRLTSYFRDWCDNRSCARRRAGDARGVVANKSRSLSKTIS